MTFFSFISKAVIRTGLIVLIFLAAIYATQNYESVDDLEENDPFLLLFGKQIDDFYYINDEFQGRWLTEAEDKSTSCREYKHCVFIAVASVANCEKGAVIEYSVLDNSEKVLGTEESSVFLARKGEVVKVELGSKLLTQKGFIEPLDAYCIDEYPSV